MLRQIDTRLWVNEVSFSLLGIDFGNRMSCIQLPDDSFCLHSPTKFDLDTYQSLAEKGSIKFLIAPSLMHNLFVMDWKAQNTESQILAPTAAKKLQVDQSLNELKQEQIKQLFQGDLGCVAIEGMPMLQEFAFIHHPSKTLILTDLAFNFAGKLPSWTALFLKLYGAYNKFGPTITIRALVKDKQAFAKSLTKILEYDFERIIVSHGEIVESGGKGIFEQAFARYLKSVATTTD